VVPLDAIDRVEWRPVLDAVNFVVHLKDGAPVFLQFQQGAGSWNAKLHQLLDQSLLAHHTVPGVDEAADLKE
jgi:hypothetical protein